MAAAGIGLSSHIWNNNLRSGALLMLYPLIIMAIVWACAFAVGWAVSYNPSAAASNPDILADFANNAIINFWPAIFTIVSLWFITAYFFHTKMVRKLSHSHPVRRMDEPELYNLLENLCISRGLPMPRLEIIETHARNAFASGINQKSYSITVTRGLLNSLQKDEVEAVLGHELTHIENRDVRLLIICIIFTGMIGFAAQMVWSSIRHSFIYSGGGGKRDGRAALVMFAIAMILWVGYLATIFTRFAISRRREYMADAGAIELTKNPDAMMRALMRIAGRERIPESTDDIAMMCIENSKPFFGLFATHPPIKGRIKAISEITGTPIPDISGAPAGPANSFQKPLDQKNPWLTRERGKRKSSL